jgi:phasin family protein
MASKNVTDMFTTNPFENLTKMLEQFKVPGVDMASIVDARRKDIDALMEANKAVYEGMQALAGKQADMLKQAVQGIQEAAQGAAEGVGAGDPAKTAELARKACEKALADMTALAEIARHSQADAMASITQRASQNMQEIKQIMHPK